MIFQRESAETVIKDIIPLIFDHYEEAAKYKDIELKPDFGQYLLADQAGLTRIFTMREEERLVGYAVFFLRKHIHYQQSLQACQDLLFVLPSYRGSSAIDFIKWCDEQLKEDGVEVVSHTVTMQRDFGIVLSRMGYEQTEIIYSKRLH